MQLAAGQRGGMACIYARHVRGVAFKNIGIKTQKPDARPEKVFIDVATVEPAP